MTLKPSGRVIVLRDRNRLSGAVLPLPAYDSQRPRTRRVLPCRPACPRLCPRHGSAVLLHLCRDSRLHLIFSFKIRRGCCNSFVLQQSLCSVCCVHYHQRLRPKASRAPSLCRIILFRMNIYVIPLDFSPISMHIIHIFSSVYE